MLAFILSINISVKINSAIPALFCEKQLHYAVICDKILRRISFMTLVLQQIGLYLICRNPKRTIRIQNQKV